MARFQIVTYGVIWKDGEFEELPVIFAETDSEEELERLEKTVPIGTIYDTIDTEAKEDY